MSTIPFTLIEGSIALPRLRPLGRHLPAPFGRDWAYRPPGYSLRIELQALYAAVIHTFCMSDQTFRSFCKWVPLMLAEPHEVIAGAPTQTSEERAAFGHAPLDQPAKFSANAQAFASVQRTTVAAPSQRAPASRNALAGGACALSGAALLAWIVLSHPPHRQTIGEPISANTVNVDQGAASIQSGPASSVTVQAVSQAVSVSAPDIASSPVNVAADSGNAPSLTSGDTSGKTAVPATALAESTANDSDRSALPHREDFHEKTGGLREEERHGSSATAAASYKPAHVAAKNNRIPSAIHSTGATQTLPKPSVAGAYSLFVPAHAEVGQYASVTTSAATPVRAVSQPPRSASASESSGAGETEWMSHLSQRRVTEIPDQFSK